MKKTWFGFWIWFDEIIGVWLLHFTRWLRYSIIPLIILFALLTGKVTQERGELSEWVGIITVSLYLITLLYDIVFIAIPDALERYRNRFPKDTEKD